jgi:hypothetical protein
VTLQQQFTNIIGQFPKPAPPHAQRGVIWLSSAIRYAQLVIQLAKAVQEVQQAPIVIVVTSLNQLRTTIQ